MHVALPRLVFAGLPLSLCTQVICAHCTICTPPICTQPLHLLVCPLHLLVCTRSARPLPSPNITCAHSARLCIHPITARPLPSSQCHMVLSLVPLQPPRRLATGATPARRPPVTMGHCRPAGLHSPQTDACAGKRTTPAGFPFNRLGTTHLSVLQLQLHLLPARGGHTCSSTPSKSSSPIAARSSSGS
jgi:hypothetical protein